MGIGSNLGMEPVFLFKTRYDKDGGTDVIYFGIAAPGTATSEAAWKILKYTYVTGDVTETNFASGSAAFSFVWDSRTTYTYS